MKTEKRNLLMLSLFTAMAFVGCEKKEIKPAIVATTTNHRMIQNYIYNEQTYRIELVYDNHYELLEITGDAEAVQKIQQQETAPSAYLIEQSDSNENTYTIHLFDDVVKMNAYQTKMGLVIPPADKNCTDYTSSGGTANYRFYEHADYLNELTFLTVSDQSYFQRDLYSAENDKISSFKLWGTTTGASVDIFEHGCFSGTTRRFAVNSPGQVLAIPNLTLFSFTTCGGYSRDIYGQIVFTPFYPCGNWNDKISSIKGWSI